MTEQSYVLPPPPRPSLPVAGTDERFAARRIFCIARNYAAHAREMGADPDREPPFFFCKPADALVTDAGPGREGGDVPYPPMTSDLQHEVELVVAIGGRAREVDAASALERVFGYSVGIDLTRRDLQREAKKLGRPWEVAKAFDASAPCGAVVPAGRCGHPERGAIWLTVNGEERQRGDLADMIWSVAEAIAHLSRYFTLEPGDLLFTGTPSGVSPVTAGDRLEAGVDGVGTLAVAIAPPSS